ncbi:RNA-binding protein 26-like isoform X2 [Oscarella lobularis]|uniref:RNA-binding protein 26-like isoform X2 n=1 Tax=Oscarella lobularis TaxID=121494 RepID=UPI003313D06B
MNIKSVESLKTWLSAKLEPICDADPAALAKYVLALLKKNKSDEQLKELCIDQLEVFLSNETNRFVEKLFDALATESYMIEATLPSVAAATLTTDHSTKERSGRLFVETGRSKRMLSPPPPPPLHVASSSSLVATSLPRDRRVSEDFSRQDSIIDDDDRDFKRTKRASDRDSPRRRSPPPPPSRSRRPTSPISTISTINSRSRNWDRDRHSYGRRNRGGDDDVRRRRHFAYDDDDRRPGRYDDKDHHHHHHHGSGGGGGGGASGGEGPRSIHGSVHERLGPRSDGGGGFREESNLVSVVTTATLDDEDKKEEDVKGKCRDYEGDQCLYEHGNAVVMEDGSHSSNRTRGGFLPPRRPMLPMMNPIHPGMMRRHGDQFSANGYNPEAPSFDGQQLPPPLPPWRHPMMPMPPMPGGFGPRFGPRGFMGPYHVPGGPHFDRKRPREQRGDRDGAKIVATERDVSAVGGSQSRQSKEDAGKSGGGGDDERTDKQKLTSTLLLKKVPNHLNNISKLNGYFQRFGTIVNMQVGVLSDPESALIQFASHAGAKRAHDCPEAVFNNRFIKVFWYKDEMGTGSIQSVAPTRGGPKSGGLSLRGGAKVAPIKLQAQSASDDAGETSPAKPSGASPRTLPSPGSLSLNKIKPVASSPKPRKEVMQKNLELQKQKQALMAKQLEQQKRLISMLETNKKMSREDKLQVMQTLKSLSASISSLKDSVASGTEAAFKQATLAQTPKQTAAAATAATPEGSQDQLDSSTAGNSGEVSGGGGGGLDVSPKTFERQQRQILVTGFSEGSADDLTEHISDFAAIENILVADSDDSSFLITFKSRRDAEIVMAHGGVYKAKPISMEWFKGQRKQEQSADNGSPPPPPAPQDAEPSPKAPESVENENEYLDPDVRIEEEEEDGVELAFEGDEEDEEDEGSRSWRGR